MKTPFKTKMSGFFTHPDANRERRGFQAQLKTSDSCPWSTKVSASENWGTSPFGSESTFIWVAFFKKEKNPGILVSKMFWETREGEKGKAYDHPASRSPLPSPSSHAFLSSPHFPASHAFSSHSLAPRPSAAWVAHPNQPPHHPVWIALKVRLFETKKIIEEKDNLPRSASIPLLHIEVPSAKGWSMSQEELQHCWLRFYGSGSHCSTQRQNEQTLLKRKQKNSQFTKT